MKNLLLIGLLALQLILPGRVAYASEDYVPKLYTSENLPIEEFRNHPMPLIAALPDDGAFLYALKPTGAVLTYGSMSQAFDWSCYTPRFIMPQMRVKDYDGDGVDDIAVSINAGSGTGVDYDELHVLTVGEDGFTDFELTAEAARDVLAERLSHEFYHEDGRLFIRVESEVNAIWLDITEHFDDISHIDEFSFIISGEIVKFFYYDDGGMRVSVAFFARNDAAKQEVLVARVFSNVEFTGDGFVLSASFISDHNPSILD